MCKGFVRHGAMKVFGKKINEKNLSVQLMCTNLCLYMCVYWSGEYTDKGEPNRILARKQHVVC